jgi:hypothetical protein
MAASSSRLDVIGTNDLARAAFWPMPDSRAVPNLVRYAFIDVPDASAWPDWDAIPMNRWPGLVLRIYHAEPGSPTADALPRLAAWYAGQNARAADVSERNAGCKARPAGEAFQTAP